MYKPTGAKQTVANGAVIYCRVSTSEQVENYSLESQEIECRRYCERNGFAVAQVFIDAGRSAKTTARRPEFQKMREYCKQHRSAVRAVVVLLLNRFSRDTTSGGAAIAEFEQLGVKVLSATENVDESPMGRFARTLLLGLAQLENDQKSERTKLGMHAALERGQWTHSAPVGYVSSKFGLRPDPDRAPMVTSAFERFSRGQYSKEETREWANRQGLRTRQGKPVSAQSFGNMLRNPLYAGWLAPRKWGGRYKGTHPPLVSEVVFDQVQAILDGRVSCGSYQLSNPAFPLRRFVRCTSCGVPLTGSAPKGRKKHYAYYSCRTRGCAGNVATESLEGQFVNLMRQLSPRPEYLVLMRALVNQAWGERQKEKIESRRRVDGQIARLVEKRAALLDALVYRKDIGKDEYEAEKRRLDDTEGQLREHYTGMEEIVDVESVWPVAERLLGQADELWRQGDLDERLQLQAVMFSQGVTYADGKFGTDGSCPFYGTSAASDSQESELASPKGPGLDYHPIFQGNWVSDRKAA